MKRLLVLFALFVSLLLPACAPAPADTADLPLPELSLVTEDAAPENSAAPDEQADDTDAHAPPAADTGAESAGTPAPDGTAASDGTPAADGTVTADGTAASNGTAAVDGTAAAGTDAAETGHDEGAPGPDEGSAQAPLPEDGSYTSKEDVALYLHLYGHLPGNFITKKEAQALGWPGGSLEPYAPGMSIGGSRFGNYEGRLPDAPGRRWTECDIDTRGAKSRGAKRIVFSNDGLIYYTEDHYESFELLYGITSGGMTA